MRRLLLLIRHGQSAWNVEHRLPGHLPGISLTEQGKEQAERLAQALRPLPISAIISSPLERAAETAQYLAQGRDLSIQYDPDLMDLNSGPWAGQIAETLLANNPARRAFLRDPTVTPPGVESFPEVEARALAAVRRWLANEATGPRPAFVTHDDVIKVLLAHYFGIPIQRSRSIVVGNASVSVVALTDNYPARVLATSWSPAPEWLVDTEK